MLAFSKDSASPNFRTLLKGRSCKAQLYIKLVEIDKGPGMFNAFSNSVKRFILKQIHCEASCKF